MYASTTLAYPLALLMLCAGAGLLADRCAGGWVPGALLAPLGAAALIALSQLTTYVHALAPATPYLMAGLALVGAWLGRERVRALVGRPRDAAAERGLPVFVSLLTYLVALAPVLLAGRASFSSFMALADSAVHMLGADHLLRDGQDYAHLDLRNSYGLTLASYYGAHYPSGADTLFGGSAFLLGLPLIWAFQPFNAFLLALAAGPAWLIARASGLPRAWAAAAALSTTLAALVYAYELLGSVKEVAALAMILALGALAVEHDRWLPRPGAGPARGARSALPFALLIAAGASALGVGFGAWALGAALVPALVLLRRARGRGRSGVEPVLGLLVGGAVVAFVAALPTWLHVSGSLSVTQAIASTSNPGNLHRPLRATQALGVWLHGSYKQLPTGLALDLTRAGVGLALASALLGVLLLLRSRRFALLGWFAAMLAAWLAVSVSATTWARAKALMLSSPAAVLLAWSGVAALLALAPGGRARRAARVLAAGLALALTVGTLASDFLQYHSSNLAPTARYDELGALNGRFAGRGPALFSDFDEYALYQLRDLDVGGPDFASPPPALAQLSEGYGTPVVLDRATPAQLRAYPLIVTRRNPAAPPAPAAYRLAWQGAYYAVWERLPGVAAALVHLVPARASGARCEQLARLAGHRSRLVVALAPALVRIDLARAARPAGWGHERSGLVIRRGGALSARFVVPHAGRWQVWLEGQFMPSLELAIDGMRAASIEGQLGGNSLVPDTAAPVTLGLAAGTHRLTLRRGGFTLAPGNGGAAVLDGILIAAAGTPARQTRTIGSAASARALCREPLAWVESLPRAPRL